MIERFKYTKQNGDVSERTVFVIQQPTDNLLAIDLSEFEPEEQVAYEEQLQTIHNEFLDRIREVGLNRNWRAFKKSRMSPITKGD